VIERKAVFGLKFDSIQFNSIQFWFWVCSGRNTI